MVTVILLLGATQGLFLTLLLLTKPINQKANKMLAYLIISYSAFIVETSVSGTEFAQQYPHILGLMAGVVFLNGPFHYLYALALTNPKTSLSGKRLFHFVPFVVFYLYFLFPFYLKSGVEKMAFIQSVEQNGLTPALMFFSWGVLFQGLIYMSVTFKLLQAHAEAIKNTFSTVDKINLRWLKIITSLTLVIWILGVIIEFLQMFGLNTPVQATVPISITILIYVMGYLGLRQPEIFSSPAELLNETRANATESGAETFSDETEPDDIKKYERSGLTKEKAQSLHKKLIHLMETQKPFTDSALKLNHLSQQISTTPNYLSQVINEEQQQNFYDFVNGYRIEEAKKMILNPSQKETTLLSIAYEVGFNSKSAFNTAFKKHAGMTPSQFRKNSD
jgi:AraC-like DNA-binding protein